MLLLSLTNKIKISRFLFHKNAAMSAFYYYQPNTAFSSTSSFRTLHTCFKVSLPYFTSSNFNFNFNNNDNNNRKIGVVVKGCSDSRTFGSNHNSDPNLNANNNNGLFGNKARVACASNPMLLRREEFRLDVGEGKESDSSRRGGVVFDGVSLPEKVVVAVDVDEVLGNFVSALNRFIADRYSASHSVSEYHVYEFFKIWKCSRDEADIRVHEFFETQYFKTGIHPLPGSKAALNNLSRFFQLSVVTSRQNVIKDHTVEWIEKHFPGLFQEIHFGNHFALHGVSRPKSEICKSLGAKVLIDDNPRYAIECAKVGIRVLLFDYENSYPWSKSDSVHQHPLVTKVHNWEEVERQLMSWIAS